MNLWKQRTFSNLNWQTQGRNKSQRGIQPANVLFEDEGSKMTRDAGGSKDLREFPDWQSVKKQRTSVLLLHVNKFCQQPKWTWKQIFLPEPPDKIPDWAKPWLYFWPTELWNNTFVLFSAAKFVVIWNSNSEKINIACNSKAMVKMSKLFSVYVSFYCYSAICFHWGKVWDYAYRSVYMKDWWQ